MASNGVDKHELRQEGAIETAQEAAQQPSQEAAQAAEKVLVEETRKAGLPAYQFDPDASPEEKAAAAAAVGVSRRRTDGVTNAWLTRSSFVPVADTTRLPS